MIARVVILPSAGDTGLLDYGLDEVPPGIEPGTRVLVPLGSRRAVAVVVELAEGSEHANLKQIVAVLDEQPLLQPTVLQLCRWMAEYYLTSIGEAVTSALPGSVRLQVQRTLAALPAPPEATPIRPADQEIYDHLREAGAQPLPALRKRFGNRAEAALARLRRQGRVEARDTLEGGEAPTKMVRFYRAARGLSQEEAQQWQRRRPAQYAVYHYLQQHPLGRARIGELDVTFRNAYAKLRELGSAGLVRTEFEETYRAVFDDTPPPDRELTLTAAQEAAVRTLEAAIPAPLFQPFLLWGVTGSGKTEVYLRAIATALAEGKSVLILVPEISLTHQVVDRVRARFGERVAVLHSGLSDGERWDEWRKLARGEVPIVVGARSAVFAPLPHLGLVIVDEEHDAAYKQEDGLHYNGRDVAVMRAKLGSCAVVLGSATPAMESYFNARSGRYTLLELPDRVESRPLPTISIIDLRRTSMASRAILISSQLIAALRGNLASRAQSLIFLNRRGYANFLQCAQCGHSLECPNCSVTLTLHKRWQALRCHHCDHTIPIPQACPSCGGQSLSTWGAGTEQVEASLRQLVPGARIARMDRDTTARKGALRKLLDGWNDGAYDILIGTQMVTKGHDVHGVTLVGVLLADQSLNFPDFRASERTFQLITQVAGRAGRGERPGRVLVQTLQPEHPSLTCAQHHDFPHHADIELAARRELGYPPFTRLVKLRCEGEDNRLTEELARSAAETARAHPGVQVLGPAPAPIERLRGRFRWHFLVRSRDSAAARRSAHEARAAIRARARQNDIRVIVDVDPYTML